MRRLFSQLGFRLAAASGALALLIGATFALLLVAIDDVRMENRLADRSRTSLTASDGVAELVLDLETGARGFVITEQERFLGPWRMALAEFPQQSRTLERLAGGPEQVVRARRIVGETRSYIHDYSIPLVQAVRRGSPAASSTPVTAAGRRRVDLIRAHLDGFASSEEARLEARQNDTESDVRRAVGLGIAGLVGSFALIAAFAIYLLRSVARPVRRTATMAGRLAEGDFAARMPEKGVGEIGDLERSFNVMAGSLERSRNDLDRLLREQAALRRVATLVAEGADPARTFEVVTREVGVLSGADLARMERYESDTEVTAIAAWSRDQPAELATGRRIELVGPSIAASVLRNPGPTRVDNFIDADGAIAKEAVALGIRSSVGCPILVEGRLWGVIAASTKRQEPFLRETESQIDEFTDLVATAIANAEGRAELIASRARIVVAADEARRRIRRDLHDGGQQRLVHALITLKLARRSLDDGDAKTEELIDEALEHTEGAVEALRELLPRNPPLGPHPRRAAGRGGSGGRADVVAGRRRRRRRAVPAQSRGDRLLRRQRGADQRRQALRSRPCGGRRADERWRPPTRDPRRRHRRRGIEPRQRPGRIARPRRRPLRDLRDPEPSRRRHPGRDDPADRGAP